MPPAVVFAFGIEGGNILPHVITISDDGTITAAGAVQPGRSRISADVMAGLCEEVAGEFCSLPAHTRCSGALPDLATRYISVRTDSGAHRVSVHGDCVPALNHLYTALRVATGLEN